MVKKTQGPSSLPALAAEAAELLQRAARDRGFARQKAQRAVDLVRARVLLRGCSLGSRVAAGGRLAVDNQGWLRIDDGVTFTGGMIPTALTVGPAARMHIGDHCVFNYGVTLEARAQVEIGARCLFGSMVRIADTEGGRSAPIVLGDDVWVAHGVTIAPGVTVGNGAVLSAGAVVLRDVPAGHLALGNPARAMKVSTVAAPRAPAKPG